MGTEAKKQTRKRSMVGASPVAAEREANATSVSNNKALLPAMVGGPCCRKVFLTQSSGVIGRSEDALQTAATASLFSGLGKGLGVLWGVWENLPISPRLTASFGFPAKLAYLSLLFGVLRIHSLFVTYFFYLLAYVSHIGGDGRATIHGGYATNTQHTAKCHAVGITSAIRRTDGAADRPADASGG